MKRDKKYNFAMKNILEKHFSDMVVSAASYFCDTGYARIVHIITYFLPWHIEKSGKQRKY